MTRKKHRKYVIKNKRRFMTAIGILAVVVVLLAVLLLKMVAATPDKTNRPRGMDMVVIKVATKVAVQEAMNKEKKTTPKAEGNLMLVNKHNSLDKNYQPKDLVYPNRRVSGNTAHQKLKKEAAEAFDQLSADAKAEGYSILLVSAYRDANYQTRLYNRYVAKSGKKKADTYSARPLYSEHQTGLAADVSSPSVGYGLKQGYINTKEGKWLDENCHKYGFIIRFPKDKENITGYEYEPWHIRYVGKEHAKKIYNKGLTLEEYLKKEAAPDYLD